VFGQLFDDSLPLAVTISEARERLGAAPSASPLHQTLRGDGCEVKTKNDNPVKPVMMKAVPRACLRSP